MRDQEKQRLKEERQKYNERFNNTNIRRKNRVNLDKPLGMHYLRNAYESKRFFKRRNSHKRIQPKKRIPKLEPKKNLGKTTAKIIWPKKYDNEDEQEEFVDFEPKLMKFPKFKDKFGKNYLQKNKNKFLNISTYGNDLSKRKKIKSYLTISEVDEQEENNKTVKNIKRTKLNNIKSKGMMNYYMDSRLRNLLSTQYKFLVNDRLNPYGTFWPSQFLKMGYDTGLQYEDFNAGVPVLKLKSLGKKKLPSIKKRGMSTINTNTITTTQNFYSKSSFRKNPNNKLEKLQMKTQNHYIDEEDK